MLFILFVRSLSPILAHCHPFFVGSFVVRSVVSSFICTFRAHFWWPKVILNIDRWAWWTHGAFCMCVWFVGGVCVTAWIENSQYTVCHRLNTLRMDVRISTNHNYILFIFDSFTAPIATSTNITKFEYNVWHRIEMCWCQMAISMDSIVVCKKHFHVHTQHSSPIAFAHLFEYKKSHSFSVNTNFSKREYH